ncbi:membrane protease YdiL (CAAX protease family) [Evansella vedderi]|uniref:Membrane protease YdiL (CAAX protease family) n=1 Tax=Evansella vedderi TaxID=38282 RepID=A0ABU0A344_9BACI|nr:CPBP family intramembrane glutamic endopeptidase [Evansella vedderi]MDQ0257675.1 membrane protease YdiL (CAAX protease family) [Evansella vedderi]
MKQADIIKNLTDKELLLNLYFTQFLMLGLALIGSRILTGNWLYPFTFIQWNVNHIIIGITAAVFVVVVELILAKFLPRKWFDDGGINERIFKGRHPLHIGFISLIVGISEEVMFRGLLQTTFGIIPASLIFALIHIRYLHNYFLFSFTILLSFFLGFLFYLTENLLTVIICHMLIDMLLGLCIKYRLFLYNGQK